MYNSKLFNASALYMYMFYSFRCTCFTALHVHVKHPFSTTSGKFLYEVRFFLYLLR